MWRRPRRVARQHVGGRSSRSPWQPPRSRRAYGAAPARPGPPVHCASPTGERRQPPPVTRLLAATPSFDEPTWRTRATAPRARGLRVRRPPGPRRRGLALRAARPAEARRPRSRRRAVGPGGRDRDRGPEPLGGGHGRGRQGRLDVVSPLESAGSPSTVGPPAEELGSAGRRRRRIRRAQPRAHPRPARRSRSQGVHADRRPVVLLVDVPSGASFPRVLVRVAAGASRRSSST